MNLEMDAADVPKVTEEMRQQEDFNNRKARHHRKTHSVASPKALTRKKMALDAWDMRNGGATWADIADKVGYPSPRAAYDAVLRYVKKRELDAGELYRMNEGARLETAIGVVMKIITDDVEVYGLDQIREMDGYEQDQALEKLSEKLRKDAEIKLKAMDRLVNIGGRMGKVFGYDAPTKVENSGNSGHISVVFDGAMAKPLQMNEPEIIVEPQD
jgi:hypothetical protein